MIDSSTRNLGWTSQATEEQKNLFYQVPRCLHHIWIATGRLEHDAPIASSVGGAAELFGPICQQPPLFPKKGVVAALQRLHLRMLSLLPNSLQFLLASLLGSRVLHHATPPQPPPLQFELRHEHALALASELAPQVIFNDIPLSSPLLSSSPSLHTLHTTKLTTHKPNSLSAFQSARQLSFHSGQTSSSLHWLSDEVPGPDVEKRETLLELAKMTYNSYYEPGSKEWYDLGSKWNKTHPHGWEPTADGLRGHIYISTDNSTVIITIKGTSAGWIVGGGGPTVKKDKINDNTLFSCCCARVGPTWSTVCDCYSGTGRCDERCLEEAVWGEGLFYPVGLDLYTNVSYMYPEANIWLAGHSLGGALSALIGATFGAPVVAFEAPGEKLAARRLHLPTPPSTLHITHVFHTGDPLAMGTCTGVTSVCAIGGYAMESRCHQGKLIRYDTVSKLGWSVDVRNHPIIVVIEKLLSEDWEKPDENGKGGREVPEVVVEDKDCVSDVDDEL
ncbi:hypothetical protein AX16_007098 [Volvariella volvacea WC 439]|nr:hypothetical protein AX16_007098 [Volvariella volvacea WC 439]